MIRTLDAYVKALESDPETDPLYLLQKHKKATQDGGVIYPTDNTFMRFPSEKREDVVKWLESIGMERQEKYSSESEIRYSQPNNGLSIGLWTSDSPKTASMFKWKNPKLDLYELREGPSNADDKLEFEWDTGLHLTCSSRLSGDYGKEFDEQLNRYNLDELAAIPVSKRRNLLQNIQDSPARYSGEWAFDRAMIGVLKSLIDSNMNVLYSADKDEGRGGQFAVQGDYGMPQGWLSRNEP